MSRFPTGMVPFLLLSLAACGGEEMMPGPLRSSVFKSLTFEREERGVSVGMNLDGYVSGSNDDRACNKEDFVAPTGDEGVDNQLATLLPLIDLVGENAVQEILQIAIDEGRLLLVTDVAIAEDGTATVDVLRGQDVPLLGTDGRILGGQTLAISDEAPLGQSVGALVDEDTLLTEPFTLRLPVVVFTQLYEVTLEEAVLRIELDEAGHVKSGLIAGGIPIAELVDVLETAANFGQDFADLFGEAVRESGDLARTKDGECLNMSASVSFEAVPTFKFR